ncbi:copper chaperone PCu(A)C [Variovorax sp. N23]|uniref:copper chaperone PCu(A)C n=1 Tax=Variovorax sp. N23 TaxID=2980555 RepID=UPI0021C93EEA|nr:copper chaperone PCu(A)C [Variovorax sp. N23]MCU4118121.1 copper chaperone PCu(A)C [Variovorax sp. N23]
MPFIPSLRRAALCMALAAAGASALAQPAAPVEVQDAWVRAAVPGQSGTGAFMKLTARAGLRLVGVSTPVAGVAEVHEMKMEGDTMRMRAIPGLDLPEHKTVELKPGGYHLMLMDLKHPVAKGTTIPLTLQFQDAQGAKSTLSLDAPVRSAAPAGAAPAHMYKH